jgi:hypothetical protein
MAKLLVTAGALAFALSRVSLDDLGKGLARLSPVALAAAIALTLANMVVGAVRWRILLVAYAAKHAPSVPFLTFVPGNVGGDVLRGHITQPCFDGPLASYMVVAQERFFGLAGLSTLGALGLVFYPIPGVMGPHVLAGFALASALVIVSVPIIGRSVFGKLPGRVGRWAKGLPVVRHPTLFGIAFVLSIVAHTVVAVTGYLLIHALAPSVTLSEAIVLVPVAMAAMYVPSVAGLGVREAGFVFLFGRIGVSAADATVASLSIFAVYGIVAAFGGLVHLLAPLEAKPAS